MVTGPIQLDTFQQSFSLNSNFRQLRTRVGADGSFIEDISAAYARGESPVDRELFDPGFNVDSPGLGILTNSITGERSAGMPLSVSEGSVTLGTQNGTEKLRISPFHDVTVRENSENSLTVFNQTTDQALRLEKGQSLTVTGQGQVEMFSGTGETLRLESGEAASLVKQDETLKLRESTFRGTFALQDGVQPLGVAGESGSSITLFTGASESLTFASDQGGAITRTDDGQLRIANRQTGESIILGARETLKAKGNAEIAIGSDPAFQIEAGDKVSFSQTDSGIEIRNKSIAGSLATGQQVQARNDSPFVNLSNSVSSQMRNFSNLLQNPASALGLSRSEVSATETKFGSVDQLIEPLSEREPRELISEQNDVTGQITEEEANNVFGEDEQSAFFAETRVSEPAENLSRVLGSTGEDGEFAIAQEQGDEFAIAEDSNVGSGEESNFAIADEEGTLFAIMDENPGAFPFMNEGNSEGVFVDQTA